MFTNGLSIKCESDALRLANYYPRVVGISIYSSDADTHDYITRIPGSWHRTLKTAEWLSGLAITMNIKCCIMQPNLKTYRKVADIARQLGAYPQFEINVTDSVDGDKCVSKFLRLKQEQMEVVLRDDNIPLYVGKEAPNYGGQQKNKDSNACGAGENSFCISPSGELMPCCAFHMAFGNLKTTSLNQIMESNLYKRWISSYIGEYEECGRYEYCDYCNLCPGMSFSEHGNWMKASENCCFIAKTRHSLAKRMEQGYDPLNGKSIDQVIDEMQEYSPQQIKRVTESEECG